MVFDGPGQLIPLGIVYATVVPNLIKRRYTANGTKKGIFSGLQFIRTRGWLVLTRVAEQRQLDFERALLVFSW